MKKATEASPRQTVEVKNFGPILEGTVELRPMTVFVGPSNTGKSYMAILIYTLHRFFEWIANYAYSSFESAESGSRFGSLTIEEIIEQISLDVSNVFKEGSINSKKEFALSGSVVAAMVDFLNTLSPRLDQRIERYFGCKVDGLSNVSSKSRSRITMRRSSSDSVNDAISVDYELGAQSLGMSTLDELRFAIDETHPLIRNLSRLKEDREDLEGFTQPNPRSSILRILIRSIVRDSVDSLASRAFYIPAERNAILHAHTEVLTSALQQMAEFGRGTVPSTPLLSGVQADYLSTIIRYLKPAQKPTEGRRLSGMRTSMKHAKLIEEDVLLGTILHDGDELIDFPFFLY